MPDSTYYDVQRLDRQITALRSKLDTESRFLNAAVTMSTGYNDGSSMSVREQAEIHATEAQRRIEFLTKEIGRLEINRNKILNGQREQTVDIPSYSESNSPIMDSQLSWSKINFKISELSYKLQIQSNMMEGYAKLANALKKTDFQKALEAVTRMEEAKQLTNILKISLKKYTSLAVEDAPLDSENDQGITMSALDEKDLISGKLDFVVNLFKGLAHETIILEMLIDGERIHSGPLKARETFRCQFELSEANELMLLIRFTPNGSIISFAFMRLGWIFPELGVFSEWTQGIELEPIGSMHICLRLDRQSQKIMSFLKPTASTLSSADNIGRQVVLKKKIRMILGHRLQSHRFYRPVKCARCNEFVLNGCGLQCSNCKYLCHKRCHELIYSKCGAMRPEDITEGDPKIEEQLKFNIPHILKQSTIVIPSWCMHCGLMVPFGRKKAAMKCEECNLITHIECSKFLPTHCGLTVELAESLINMNSVPPSPIKSKNSYKSNGTIEDYDLLSVLGRGNFGKVLLAQDKNSGEKVAIKALKKDQLARHDDHDSIKAELAVFDLAVQNGHPFLVHLRNYFENSSYVFFVMEYVGGGDLMYHIQRRKFSENESRLYAAQILLAIEFLHSHGVIYRDLKLDNIMLTPSGHIKMTDYGLAKTSLASATSLTRTYCGTPDFMAPEIVMEHPYDQSVDWWAFGILIYEMLVGKAPFYGKTEAGLFKMILYEETKFPPWMSKDAKDLIKKLLIKQPSKRLGYGKKDASPIKQHSFFKGINWSDLQALKVTPSYVPTFGDSHKSCCYFETEFTSQAPILTPTTSIKIV